MIVGTAETEQATFLGINFGGRIVRQVVRGVENFHRINVVGEASARIHNPGALPAGMRVHDKRAVLADAREKIQHVPFRQIGMVMQKFFVGIEDEKIRALVRILVTKKHMEPDFIALALRAADAVAKLPDAFLPRQLAWDTAVAGKMVGEEKS